jgi:hypothetical protein
MLTVKITQRLHLWAEFDGAFYRPHSTQARAFVLKCAHYGNVDGEYRTLRRRLLLCTFLPLQRIKSQPANGTLEIWEVLLRLKCCLLVFPLFRFIGSRNSKKFSINFHFCNSCITVIALHF